MTLPTNPYVGPRTFSEEDRRFFFGREREARDLTARILSERLLLFYAQSASLVGFLRERLGTRELLGFARAVALGDPFLLSHHLPLWPEDVLARQMGASFAAGVMAAPLGRWSEPVVSAYGLHVVFVHERTPEQAASLDAVRKRVDADLMRDREQRAMRAHLDALRAEAVVEVTATEGSRAAAPAADPAGRSR